MEQVLYVKCIPLIIASLGLWDVGIRGISEALQINTTLTELDLRNNRIGSQGGIALAACIKKSSSLIRIGTKYN